MLKPVYSKLYIVWQPTPTARMQWVSFDAVMNETQEALTAITEHPVEDGPDVADHARPEPLRISIEGLVTETPGPSSPLIANQRYEQRTVELEIPRTAPKLTSLTRSVTSALGDLINPPSNKARLWGPAGDFKSRVRATYDLLMMLREKGARLRVVTAICELENMMIERVAVPRTADYGGGASLFQVDLRQVRIVKSKTVDAPVPAEARGAVPVSKGSQATKEAPPRSAETLKSTLAGTYDGVAGLLSKGPR